MTNKFGTIVTYLEGLLAINSFSALIVQGHVINENQSDKR